MGDTSIPIPSILGLPPDMLESATNTVRDNSFPIAYITPCKSEATMGATVFDAKPAWKTYHDILEWHGYDYPGKSRLTVAFQADNFPADNFQNEYGQSLLEQVSSFVGSNVSDIAQMIGNPVDVGNNVLTSLKDMGGMAAKIGDMGQGAFNFIGDNTVKFLNSSNDFERNVAKTMAALATGGRIDFPMVWKNSSFSPSYSMTVRLYNPNPQNDASTETYIIGPVAALLLLACPQSKTPEGSVIKWPFIHLIEIPGLCHVKPAYISNVSVIKGGDQQSIAWNQRVGIVDVRIDFASLFNSLVVETDMDSVGMFGERRPTLHNYISAMATKKRTVPIKHSNINISQNGISIQPSFDTTQMVTTTPIPLNNSSVPASDNESPISSRISQDSLNNSAATSWNIA